MVSKKEKKTMPVQRDYQQLASQLEPKRPAFINCLRAFLVGGCICILGQAIQDMFVRWAGFDKQQASNPTVAVLILISVILTSLGVYDKIAQWAGAGSAVPVTGFANAMASAAIEHRSEGLVLGVGGNMFKVAGAVIVFGTFAAFVVGVLTWIIEGVGGGS
ncbi:stage V sporulation protein AC [Paenibacillus nasutitermitis]|uniref:Stage V sporulation protein AC n=1 Tax=Paenibacillus nasutitermitis TaxID=1652958 RepID=A0A917DYD6_9BACL|nr:stage V sporulation protein AC [Paenibacillus nasutitermitis]GGD80633.1 stage V sporulation protein AC [Paenibacillus nasutitermitis]